MSFVCGQIISRTGRYRAFPIVGSLFVILGARPALAAGRRLLRRSTSRRRRRGRHRDGDDGADVHHRHAERRRQLGRRDRDRRAAVLPLDGRQPRRRGPGRAAGRAPVGRAEPRGWATRRRGIDQDRLLEGSGAIPSGLVAATQDALGAALHSVFLALIPIAALGLVFALRLEERHAADGRRARLGLRRVAAVADERLQARDRAGDAAARERVVDRVDRLLQAGLGRRAGVLRPRQRVLEGAARLLRRGRLVLRLLGDLLQRASSCWASSWRARP